MKQTVVAAGLVLLASLAGCADDAPKLVDLGDCTVEAAWTATGHYLTCRDVHGAGIHTFTSDCPHGTLVGVEAQQPPYPTGTIFLTVDHNGQRVWNATVVAQPDGAEAWHHVEAGGPIRFVVRTSPDFEGNLGFGAGCVSGD